MTTALFWTLAALVAWSLAGYSLLWLGFARLAGPRPVPPAEIPLRATILIAARNEAPSIRRKIASVLAQETAPHRVDILVVSDGSEDATLDEALAIPSERVRAFQTETHGGKAAALNAGLARIDADVVIFSDANSILRPGALRAILAPLADPAVGGVCGRPEPEAGRGGWLGRAERLYWRYDSSLKLAESRLGGAVSAQGTLYAVRREFLPPSVPADVADDFYISVQVVAGGARLAFAPEAVAVEPVTERAGDEFMRRVRSTERGWRAVLMMARLLDPRRHGLYAVQLLSHKVLRRLTAFFLPLLLLASLVLADEGTPYALAAASLLVLLAIALAAAAVPALRRLPGAAAASFFVMGHTAMAVGILRATAGRRSVRWTPAREGGVP